MVRFDSWRAAGPGNRTCRSLATKSTKGGRAIRRAVTRVKSEQAPKAAMWTPTRRETGEGRTNREEPGAGARQHDNHRAPNRSTGVVGTARRKGNQRNWGRLGMAAESRTANAAGKGSGLSGSRRGSRYRGSRVMPVEGRTLTSGVFEKKGRNR
jgi:hypothetical protein